MASDSKISHWLFESRKTLLPQVSELTWIKSWLPNFYDFQVKIGQECGRGIDTDETVSFEKAISEVVERSTCRSLGVSSWGVAAHSDLAKAKKNSKMEFVERYTFLFHFKNKLPLRHLNVAMPEMTRKNLDANQISLNFYAMNCPEGLFGVLAVGSGANRSKPFGAIIGLSCDDSEENAITKAQNEALRNIAAFLDGNLGQEEAGGERLSSPEYRRNLALDFEYWKRVQFLFDYRASNETSISLPSFLQEILPLPEEFKSSPIKVVRTFSDSNWDRVSGDLPHFIG